MAYMTHMTYKGQLHECDENTNSLASLLLKVVLTLITAFTWSNFHDLASHVLTLRPSSLLWLRLAGKGGLTFSFCSWPIFWFTLFHPMHCHCSISWSRPLVLISISTTCKLSDFGQTTYPFPATVPLPIKRDAIIIVAVLP